MITPSPAIKSVRSPSYPTLSLSDAIAQVRKIEAPYRLGPVDRIAGVKLIGYSTLSGPAAQALASLAQYGLIERAGKGEMRVTELARAILHPDSDEEKRTSLRMSALQPQLFQDLYERWPNTIPPEDGVISYLSRQGFNISATRPAAKAYLQTLLFLQESGANEAHSGDSPKDFEPQPQKKAPHEGLSAYGGAKVGDLIQWEIGGNLQLEKPTRVRLVTDEGWLAVEGSETGIPMNQVIVVEPSPAATVPPPSFKFADAPAERNVRLGETEWMRNKVSKSVTVSLFVSGGEMGAKEIGKLITLLAAQQAVLNDDEKDDA